MQTASYLPTTTWDRIQMPELIVHPRAGFPLRNHSKQARDLPKDSSSHFVVVFALELWGRSDVVPQAEIVSKQFFQARRTSTGRACG